MPRFLGLPRLALGLAVFPVAALLAAACGGSDVIDSADASAMPDGAFGDAHGSEAALSDTSSPDADGASMNGDSGRPDADAGMHDAASADADAASTDADAGVHDAEAGVDADAAQPDADAAVSDSGTSSLMQSLGTAAPFVVLGAATLTNSGNGTVIIGDIGTTGPAAVGFSGPPSQPSGSIEVQNARASTALLDVGTAYTALANRPCSGANNLTGQDLGGKTLAPGVYCFTSSAGQAGATTLTFDAQGDPNAVWVIQVGTLLTIMDNAVSVVINGPGVDGVQNLLDDGKWHDAQRRRALLGKHPGALAHEHADRRIVVSRSRVRHDGGRDASR